MERIQAVKERYQDVLLQKPNVVGVGIGYRHKGGKPTRTLALVVMVTRKVPPHRLKPGDLLPRRLEDVIVDVQEVGELLAQPSP